MLYIFSYTYMKTIQYFQCSLVPDFNIFLAFSPLLLTDLSTDSQALFCSGCGSFRT